MCECKFKKLFQVFLPGVCVLVSVCASHNSLNWRKSSLTFDTKTILVYVCLSQTHKHVCVFVFVCLSAWSMPSSLGFSLSLSLLLCALTEGKKPTTKKKHQKFIYYEVKSTTSAQWARSVNDRRASERTRVAIPSPSRPMWYSDIVPLFCWDSSEIERNATQFETGLCRRARRICCCNCVCVCWVDQ